MVAALAEDLSPSTQKALDWAAAAALLRSGGPATDVTVDPADVLVGVLLSHPDEDGEGPVLLTHFGLTGRDVLPPTYPGIQVTSLRTWAAELGPDTRPQLSSEAEMLLTDARSLASDGQVHLRMLLGSILQSRSTTLWTSLEQAFTTTGTPLDTVTRAYIGWLEGRAAGSASAPSKASARPVAGRSLRAMLEREFPQRPVDLPTYSSDVVGGGDLVGIRAEVDAFAYLLASRDLTPPLAVGLFGNWGSGKSFMMTAVKRRIEQIETQVRDDPQTEVRFWKHIRQVEFNAWQYVQGSLWASLLDHIFVELEGTGTVDLLEQRRRTMSTELNEAWIEQRARADRRQDAAEEVASRSTALATAERQRDVGLRLLPEAADDVRTREVARLRDEASKAVGHVWGTRVDVAGDATDLLDALRAARQEVSRGRALLGPYWTSERVRTAAYVAAAFLVGTVLLAWGLSALDLPAALGGVGAVAAAVPTVARVLQSATAWTARRLDEIERVEVEVQEELARRRAALDRSVEEARRGLERANADLRRAKLAEEVAVARADDLTSRLRALTPGRVLQDFLTERSRSDDYRRHLGLLSMVRADLAQLEELVRRNNEEVLAGRSSEGQVNRIILYIDDLDRCPDDKVIEVLEAVHLLLAFELFVVVVAVDTRWLRHALTKRLPALADGAADGHPGGRATPQDYLEKIFQLPFWVQPLEDAGRVALIRGLLEGSIGRAEPREGDDQGPSPLRVGAREERIIEAMLSRGGGDPRREAQRLTVTREELGLIASLAPLLGDTPRGVKRFVNVFQLLSVLPTPDGHDAPAPSNRQLMAFLAALHDGHRELARALASQLAHAVGTLEQLLKTVPMTPDERADLDTWLAERPSWQQVPVERVRQLLPTVRRLSFDHELS